VISDKSQIIEKATKSSSELFNITMNEKDYLGYFTSISKCNNPECGEIITITGETKLRYAGKREDFIERGEDFEFQGNILSYIVKYTNPAIRLFKVPKSTPEELLEIINRSFELFWVDEDSCGNKIRSSIEKLLDFQKINKTTINKKGRRQKLNLHQRIKKFEGKEPEIVKYLLALKWIGNQGSHSSSKLSRKELIDAYEILEVSLLKLYDNRGRIVKKLVDKINKEKKHNIK